jgi:hypothetical protein
MRVLLCGAAPGASLSHCYYGIPCEQQTGSLGTWGGGVLALGALDGGCCHVPGYLLHICAGAYMSRSACKQAFVMKMRCKIL